MAWTLKDDLKFRTVSVTDKKFFEKFSEIKSYILTLKNSCGKSPCIQKSKESKTQVLISSNFCPRTLENWVFFTKFFL